MARHFSCVMIALTSEMRLKFAYNGLIFAPY